jgi:hypothetical protein
VFEAVRTVLSVAMLSVIAVMLASTSVLAQGGK